MFRQPQGSTGEFYRGWGTLLAAFAGLAFSISTLSVPYTIGVFIDPLRLEFGWSRAQILATSSVVSVAVGASTFVVGWLTDRVNVRRLIIGSQVAFGLAFFLMAGGIRDLPTFYGLYLLMAIAGAATIAVPFAKLITAEFVENRGLALGLAMSGTGICGLLVPPYAAYVVEHFGWRAGYVAVGILPLAFAVPLSVLFLRNLSREDRPSQRQQAHKISGVDEKNALGLGEAVKGFRFWLLCVIFTIGSSVMTALLANFVPILTDKGYSPTLAAAIAGSFGITVIAGRVAVGVLIDRIWAPLVGSVIFAAAAIAIGLLATVYLTTAGLIVLILLTGFAAGAEVDLMGFLVARYFGLRDFGKIYAAMYIGFALAPGLFTPLFGAGRDQFGSYTPSLHVAAGALAAAALLLLALGKYPKNLGKSSTA